MVELLTLRRRTIVDELVDSVPRPESGVPTYALPGWKDVSLDLKLPMLKCPNNQIIFSRAKVGQKLWKTFEFSPKNFKIEPLGNCVSSCQYQPLHDPHLKKFFQKSPFKEKIRAIGKVTSNNDVICKLKEFNEYRQYLKQVHVDSIIAKRKIEDEIDECKNRLQQVELYRKKEQNFIHVLQQRDLLNKDKRLEILKEKELRKKKLLQTQIRCDEAYERYKQLTKLKALMLREKLNKRENHIRKRVKAARQEALRRIILLKKRCYIYDRRRNSKIKASQDEKLKQKQILAEYRWNLHILFRQEHHYKTMKILQKNEATIAKNVKKRNAYVRKQWEDIENRILKKKISKIHKNYEKRGKKQFTDAIKHSIKKLRKKKRKSKKNKNTSVGQIIATEDPLNIDKRKENLLRLSNYDKYVNEEKLLKDAKNVSSKQLSEIIQTSMSFIQKEQANSMSVLMCAKKLLTNVNKNIDFSEDSCCLSYTTNRVEETMDTVTRRVLEAIKKVLETVCHTCSSEELQTVNVKKSTQSKFVSQNYSKSGIMSGVSFGNVTHFTHLIEDENEMKSIKDRAPTPVASLSSLAVTVLETPNIEDDFQILPINLDDKMFHGVTQDQRLIIEYKLVKFKKELIKKVEYRTFAGIDFYGCRRIMKIHHDVLDIDKSYLINNMTIGILNNNKFMYASNFRLMTSYISSYILNEIQKIIDKHPNKIKKITNHLSALNKCKCHGKLN